ncbi:hypothetical protein BS50DRAFT_271178 [Corynespora cassiicola Philippines]|uniref:Uncharacterized protein n=1 Tax=Corynespora cassiicola Philippines TaxID=1448308 RepID=A0A2T2P018_CORCC|nr:hypothetical protein BS50DRAFT_271178 [Corynespora cassiicola Philippines]
MDCDNRRTDSPNLLRRKPVPPCEPANASERFTLQSAFAATIVAGIVFSWPVRWIFSGAPLLFYSLILGQANGYRVLPFIPFWSIFATVNLAYVVASTSWLLYWAFILICYPSILLSCLFQFDAAGNFARRAFRKLICDVHFIRDTVSFFGLPALEIDKDIFGLLVIRGVTISLSTLTATAHGVEVGIKLMDDMELAIQTEKVVVSLFRRIEIGDVYANVKGGEGEMSFADLHADAVESADQGLLSTNTPILLAAAAALTKRESGSDVGFDSVGDDSSIKKSGLKATAEPVIKISPDEAKAREKYDQILQSISDTSAIRIAREKLKEAVRGDSNSSILDTESNLRAAICAHIHNQPSIPHPPSQSIKLSTIRNSSSPSVKRFLHRLPFLLRALLNPLSYFHPVSIANITVAGSGEYMVTMMRNHLFKHYAVQDSDIRRLERRITNWFANANFTAGLSNLYCTAQVPINTIYDIECNVKIQNALAHRTLSAATNLNQVVQLGGADAIISLPSYLLPHHEHILPPKLTSGEELELEQAIEQAEGTPRKVQLARELEQRRKDETNMKISAHAHLPATFDQELLNFVAAILKASKVIEIEKEHEELILKRASTEELEMDLQRTDSMASTASDSSLTSIEENSEALNPASPKSFNRFMRRMDRGFKDMNFNMKDGWRRASVSTVQAMANDRWIARIVGNVMRKLEKAQGDVGYSGLIPLSLAPFREKAEEDSKILP